MRNNIHIIMLGDSLTARGDWKELLKIDSLVNLGVDGETTKDMMSRLTMVIELKPRVVFVMAGINDLSHSISVEDIFKNYESMINTIKDEEIQPIIQATLYTTMIPLNKKVTKFNKMLEEYALKNGIEFIDLNPSFIDDEGLLKSDLTTDGLHLGQKAYKAWAYKIKQVVTHII